MFKALDIKKMRPIPSIGGRELIGIDFSPQSLKLARAIASPGKIYIANLIEKNISGLSEDDISKNINLAFKEMRPKKPSVLTTLPAYSVITKNIEIPSVDADEIRKIVNLQANRHTPYSREEIAVDYIDLGVYKQSYTKILLIIVARNIVRKRSELLNKAGLKVEKIVLSSEILGLSIPKMFRLGKGDAPVNVVHVDKESSEFIIIYKNKVLYIRSIPIGTQQLMVRDERYKARFVDEIKKSLEAYQGENIERNPDRIFLTGAVDELSGMDSILSQAINLTTTKSSYSENINISNEVRNTISNVKESSFLSVIASLISYNEAKINFIPEEIKIRRTLEKRGRELVKTGILALTAVVLIFSILASKIYFKETYLKKLTSRYQSLNQEAQKFEKDFAKIGVIRNYLSTRGYSLSVLAELYDIMPADLEFSYIRFDGDKIFLGGTAESMSTVFAFVTNMEKSGYFKEVQTRRTTKRKDGLKNVTDFEITSIITKEVP